MRWSFLGAALIVAGIAGRIEAGANRPLYGCGHPECLVGTPERLEAGLAPWAYDLLRVSAWALLVFGAVVLALGLIRAWRSG